MQWVINAFILFSAMLQILGGHLGDTFERRSMFLIGTVIFVIASVVAGVASNLPILIIGRILQGIALGLAYPVSIIITNSIFPKNEQGLAMGVIMGVMGFSLALGPTIGGIVVEYLSWRWIFFINVPIGILTVLMTLFLVPKIKAQSHPSLDLPGNITLMAMLFLIILALNQSTTWGLGSNLFLTTLFAGIGCLILLYFIERATPKPIINFSLFTIRNFNLNCLLRLISQTAFIPILFFLPLYLVNIANLTAVHAGFYILAMTLVVGLLSPFAGTWVDKWGDKKHTLISMLLFALGSASFISLQAHPDLVLLITGLVLIGIGCGINFVSTTVGALSAVPQEESGVATGIFFTIMWTSCSFAIAVCGAILSWLSEQHLLSLISQKAIHLSQNELSHLIRAAQGLIPFDNMSGLFISHDIHQLKILASQSFMYGFHAMMLFLFLSAILGIVLSLLLKTKVTIGRE